MPYLLEVALAILPDKAPRKSGITDTEAFSPKISLCAYNRNHKQRVGEDV
jgi:hypothetical protein